MPDVRTTSGAPPVQPAAQPRVASHVPARPKALVVATDLPWPLDSGWRIRAYENVRSLGEFADVTLVSFCEDADPSEHVAELRAALSGVRVEEPVHHRIHIKENPLRLVGAVARGLTTRRPYKVAKFSSRAMSERLRALPDLSEFDVVHAELATLQYVGVVRRGGDGSGPLVVLDTHNVESRLLADHCDRGEFGWLTPAVRFECARTKRYEAWACAGADLVLAISEDDAVQLRTLGAPSATVVTVPPVAEVATRRTRGGAGPTVLFVGQLSWLPNQEAVRWLCDEVLPRLQAREGGVEVAIVGGGAPPSLVDSIQASGATALGYVEDLTDLYERAAVYVSPFLTGGGVRIKLLEAMRHGIPVVSTAVGAKGLDAESGSQILIADTPVDFAGAVDRLLADADLADSVATAAQDYIRAHHSHESVTGLMRDAYRALQSTLVRADASDVGSVASAGAALGQGGGA